MKEKSSKLLDALLGAEECWVAREEARYRRTPLPVPKGLANLIGGCEQMEGATWPQTGADVSPFREKCAAR